MKYTIVIALGVIWLAQPAAAQTADSSVVAPSDFRIGPPPKRGAPPVRKSDERDQTLNQGKVTWSPRHVELGTFAKGNPKTQEIKVTNISKEPLEIKEIKTSCHCTSAEWTKGTIKPGQSGTIVVRHNAEDVGEFLRIVSVKTNFDPENWVLVSVTGTVTEQ